MEQNKRFKNELTFNMHVPFMYKGERLSEITLLKTNGIAEEVFGKRGSEKPYTWIGNVITVSTAAIGSHKIGADAREEFEKDKVITIPSVVKAMPMAEANSMLVELHRRIWKDIIPDQSILCKVCGKTLNADIDLNKIDLTDKNKQKLASVAGDTIELIQCVLEDGSELWSIIEHMKKTQAYPELEGKVFKEFTFRVPTLGDAIRHESYTSDNIMFWRRIAGDCIVSIKDSEGLEFPVDLFQLNALKAFRNYFTTEDLGKIRQCLVSEVPTMPFSYEEECPCPMTKTIPYSMEASDFFSV